MDRLCFGLELKALDSEGVFEGYASTFGNRDLGGDIVEPGAFTKSLAAKGAKGVKMLLDHDPRNRIGAWTDIKEDDTGLFVKGKLFMEKQIGRDTHVDLKGGALDKMSIGYRTQKSADDGRRRARLLKEVDLLEISLVTFPMNEQASVTAVKAADEIKTIREFEDFLRDVGGFSHAKAKAIAASGFKGHSDPRDEDGGDLADMLRRNINLMKGHSNV
jgi:HK97 family phage prohead protease